MSSTLTLDALIEAKKRGLTIRHIRKGTEYSILCIGKAKDDKSNQWEASVTFSDGSEFYTRFLRDMGGFEIIPEHAATTLESPRHFTVTFEINSLPAFSAINKICGDSLASYDPEDPPLVGAVGASQGNEILRTEIIEHIIESNTVHSESLIKSVLDKANPSIDDLEKIQSSLKD